jgi:hypothetical protein
VAMAASLSGSFTTSMLAVDPRRAARTRSYVAEAQRDKHRQNG